MNTRSFLIALLSAGLLWSTAAWAEPPVKVQNEVNYLLGYVAGSGCEFSRNGTRYNAREAQQHLRTKYHYLVAKNELNETEEFIERAASESSISGIPYQVHCKGAAPMDSNPWLREQLVELRTTQ